MSYIVTWAYDNNCRQFFDVFKVPTSVLFLQLACFLTCGCNDSSESAVAAPGEKVSEVNDPGVFDQQSVDKGKVGEHSLTSRRAGRFRDTTPLILTILDRSKDRFNQLLDDGANPNEWDKYGRNALTVAASIPDTQFWLQVLLSHGGNPSAKAPDSENVVALVGGGFAPLHIAASHQGCEINVRLLVEAGADVNAANAYGITPLGLAVEGGFFDVAGYLVEHGADPNTECSGGLKLRDLLNDIASDDYPLMLSSSDQESLNHLLDVIAARDSE